MRPLFWPTGRIRAATLALPAFRPSRDLMLAILVAIGVMAASWTAAMAAAFIILTF
jgi:hypothetical protein